MTRPVLIKGAAGFIGAAPALRLLERGERVVGIDNIHTYYDPALKRARLLRMEAIMLFQKEGEIAMSESFQIPYRYFSEYLPVDLNSLRPGNSYDHLIQERDFPIKSLIQQFGSIPPDFLKSRFCPCCGSDDFEDEALKDHLKLVKCANCGVVYVNPVFDEAHYEEIYKSKDYQQIVQQLGEQSHLYRVDRFGAERISMLNRFIKQPHDVTYMDVGCSTGFVVEAATRAGWASSGIDLNPSAIKFGQGRGLDLENISLFDKRLDDKKFDIISMFDVLEHVVNPADFVDRAHNLLADKGLLFLYVPNYESASKILMGLDAHFIWPTHHLTYFSPYTLSNFIKSKGFELELLNTEGLDIADYIWYQSSKGRDTSQIEEISESLQFMINAGCYGKNLRLIARKR